MRKQTYGRRNATASAVTAQCFFGSSPTCAAGTLPAKKIKSPEKRPNQTVVSPDAARDPALSAAIPDSPAPNIRSRTKMREASVGRDKHGDMSPLAVKSDAGEDLVSKIGRLQSAPEDGSNILQPRHANAGTRRQKSQAKVNQVKVDTRGARDTDKDLEKSLDALCLSDERKVVPSISSTTKRKPTTCLDYTAYTKPLLRLCGDPQGRKKPTPFQDWADDIAAYFHVVKIAEASYGEVYRLSLKDVASSQEADKISTTSRPRSPLGKADESVLKILALKPPPKRPTQNARATSIDDHRIGCGVEDESSLNKSAVTDVASEVRLLRHLSPIPGFTNFREVRVVQGRVPKPFVQAWRAYNKNVKKSLFPDPGLKRSYDEHQLWAVVEMQDAGTDVETLIERTHADASRVPKPKQKKGQRGQRLAQNPEQLDVQPPQIQSAVSVWTAWDIFWGVALAVAKGEEYAGFEHRDLHMGNICIRSKHMPDSHIFNPALAALDTSRTVGYTGLETTLIDYTLSRAEVGTCTPSASTPTSSHATNTGEDGDETDSADESVAFFDLSKDEAIFEGDASEDYQYDIYRFMRSAVLNDGDPAFDLRKPTNPQTQIQTQAQTHTGTKQTSASKREKRVAEASKQSESQSAWRQRHPVTNLVWLHFVLFQLMQGMPADAGEPGPGTVSAEGKTNSENGEAMQLERELRGRLRVLRRLLKLEKLATGELRGAAGLVQWALEAEWLDERDVIGSHA